MIPARTIVTTSPWNGFDPGTSRKSAIQPDGRTPVRLPGFVTDTSFRVPAGRAGAVAWTWVASTTWTAVAGTLPILTVAPATKPAPTIVVDIPPPEGPEPGLMTLTAGEPGRGVGVRDGVRVAVGVREAVDVEVRDGVRVGVFEAVKVGVRDAVNVRVLEAVEVGVFVAVDVAVADPSKPCGSRCGSESSSKCPSASSKP